MHQLLLTSAPVFSTIRPMIKLIDQMHELIDNALANGCPCILATAAPDGEPDIGYKGSMMVFDDESLAYWERTRRQHLKTSRRTPRSLCCFAMPRQKSPGAFTGSPRSTTTAPLGIRSWRAPYPRSWKKIPSAKARPSSSGLIGSPIWAARFCKADRVFRAVSTYSDHCGFSGVADYKRQCP